MDRLWDIGTVEQHLENAFSAIANSELVVVEQTPDAQAVVEFVRKHHLGRVTCIVLERVRQELSHELNGLRKKKIPDGAKLLIDLVNIPNPEHEVNHSDGGVEQAPSDCLLFCAERYSSCSIARRSP